MAKATPTKKRTVFSIPTQQEVADWIYQAMGVNHPKDQTAWPRRFCEYMAEKFWNRYQAAGWQYGGRMMKDWGAAFHAQWKHLKYKEDKDMLEKFINEPLHQMHVAKKREESDGMFASQYGTATVGGDKPAFYYIEYYQKLMESYFQGQVPEKDLWKHYDRLKALGVMRLPREQITLIYELMGNNRDYGKTLSVARLFKNLNEQKITLKQLYDKVHQPAATRQ